MKLIRDLTGNWVRLLVVAALAVGVLAGRASLAARDSQGTVRISGAFALYPLMVKWGEEFQKANPGVRIEVSAGGAGKGAADALSGLVDIGMVSREIHPEEMKKGGWWIPVVKDAVVATANSANPAARDLRARGVRRETFAALWIKGQKLTWGDVAGNARIKDGVQTYTRADACGAAETWGKYLGGKQEDLQGVGVANDPGVAEAVRKDRNGIGYNNIAYAYDAKTGKPVRGLIVVPIDINGNGKLDKPESFYATKAQVTQAIAEGVYPSPPARDLNLLTKGKPTGVTREFLLWILRDGRKYVDEAGYVELPKGKLDKAVRQLK